MIVQGRLSVFLGQLSEQQPASGHAQGDGANGDSDAGHGFCCSDGSASNFGTDGIGGLLCVVHDTNPLRFAHLIRALLLLFTLAICD